MSRPVAKDATEIRTTREFNNAIDDPLFLDAPCMVTIRYMLGVDRTFCGAQKKCSVRDLPHCPL
jgi:hypothetical protein